MSLRSAARHRLVLSGIVFAAVAGSGAALSLRAPVYEATAQVIVTPLGAEDAPVGMPVLRDLGDPIRTIETAAALLDTRGAAELSAQRLGSPWTADRVADVVTVTPLGQTNLIDISARADEGTLAADVANTYTTATLDLRSQALAAASTAALNAAQEQLASNPGGSDAAAAAQERVTLLELLRTYGDPSASEAQDAVAPAEPSGLPGPAVLGLSALAGLLAAAAVAVLLTSRSPEVPSRAAEGALGREPLTPRGPTGRVREPVPARGQRVEHDVR